MVGIPFMLLVITFPIRHEGLDQPRQLSKSTGSEEEESLPLPSPRTVSIKLLNGPTSSEAQARQLKHTCSLLVAQWAQFIYEDIGRIGANRLFPSGQRQTLNLKN
jgi:hypothetical protein